MEQIETSCSEDESNFAFFLIQITPDPNQDHLSHHLPAEQLLSTDLNGKGKVLIPGDNFFYQLLLQQTHHFSAASCLVLFA